jgi:hypothetical protein
MSLKSISIALAITASISHAEKMNLAKLLSLQTDMVHELDHALEAIIDNCDVKTHMGCPHGWTEMSREVKPSGDIICTCHNPACKNEVNDVEKEMVREVIGTDSTCPLGYIRVGCCKCVLEKHSASVHHLTQPEEGHIPSIHHITDSKEYQESEFQSIHDLDKHMPVH